MAFLLLSLLRGFRRCVQAAKQRAVWLSLAYINGKYLWALPTPTTFEKVDQTFIITCRNNLLNHNLIVKYLSLKKCQYAQNIVKFLSIV